SDGIPTTISSNANNISHTSNNVTSNISPNTISDAGASTSPRQYKLPTSSTPSATMAASYQRHPSSLQPNIVANNNNMTDYAIMTTNNNSEQSYQVLPPLVGIGGMSIGGAGNSNANNGQGTGILPSLIGLNDQFAMPTSQQQQQLQQLQNVGFTGFMSGGNSGMSNSAGFGATNTF
ncbi:9088_t:CDS:2, partial [Dentiscutata heterogama]